jgi:hypothetical protein
MGVDNADFSGWATKAGLKCADGRTIMPEAFAHMDGKQVPLVWQHGHSNPENVLGHAVLEARPEGMYAYGFFNGTEPGQQAKALVQHKDINSLSIWANQLVERSKQVFHGAIRELSLVLSGANPGAVIENVAIAHSDGGDEILADEAVIYTGLDLDLKHDSVMAHADAAAGGNEKTIQDVFDSMTDEQKQVVYYMVGAAIEEAQGSSGGGSAAQSAIDDESDESLEHADGDGPTVQDVFNGMSEEQKQVVYYMIGSAVEESGSNLEQSAMAEDNTGGSAPQTTDNTDGAAAEQGTDKNDNTDGNLAHGNNDEEEGTVMTHNVFENQGSSTGATGPTELTHDQLSTIVEDAKKPGMTLKSSFLAHAVEYGIENIDVLFPDAKAITNAPELISRRLEWVNVVLNGVRKSPFSRIKTVTADVTLDEARAKGYVKGSLKKDEWFRLAHRVTTPTTIYKKQKLDRDDIIDITDLDVVAFMKGEMRLMLDEEIARAILIGDGREIDDEDKVDETCIRPIAHDDDFYTHHVTIPANVGGDVLVESIVRARSKYRGSGRPILFLVEDLLTDMLLAKDKMGRRLYATEADLMSALRVGGLQTVDAMEDLTTDGGDVLAVLVNLADYTVGADRGGNVSMFDDFDIDYNQYKYLIETRMSGALTKFKSAQVFVRAAGTLVTPAVPTFVAATGVVTIPATAGVIYTNDDTGDALTAGDQPALAAGETLTVAAAPADGYYFPHNTDADWDFTRPAA